MSCLLKGRTSSGKQALFLAAEQFRAGHTWEIATESLLSPFRYEVCLDSAVAHWQHTHDCFRWPGLEQTTVPFWSYHSGVKKRCRKRNVRKRKAFSLKPWKDPGWSCYPSSPQEEVSSKLHTSPITWRGGWGRNNLTKRGKTQGRKGQKISRDTSKWSKSRIPKDSLWGANPSESPEWICSRALLQGRVCVRWGVGGVILSSL